MTAGTAAPAPADTSALRQFTPAATELVYLNTGTAGPLLTPVVETMRRAALDESRTGRAAIAGFERLLTDLGALRAALAEYMGAGADEIALTHHTTEGMNIVTWGLDLRAGDRVVTTSLEHGGALLPLYQLRNRVGVELEFVEIGAGEPEEALAALSVALERPAKLLVVSHVLYGTGAVLPLRRVAELAHERGALLLVDGAQSVGAIPLDLDSSGVDFYSFPGQKWLCGPEGTGGLFVRRAHLDLLQATQVGGFGCDHAAYRANDPDSLVPASGAARYEVGSVYRPAMAGLLAGVNWHLDHREKDELFQKIHRLAGYALDRASELPDTEVVTPGDAHAGLVSFIPTGVDPDACVAHLASHGVQIRYIPENGALRLSCGFFNTSEEIDMALSLIESFRGNSR